MGGGDLLGVRAAGARGRLEDEDAEQDARDEQLTDDRKLREFHDCVGQVHRHLSDGDRGVRGGSVARWRRRGRCL
jgi:hypothetical protein